MASQIATSFFLSSNHIVHYIIDQESRLALPETTTKRVDYGTKYDSTALPLKTNGAIAIATKYNITEAAEIHYGV